MQLTDFVILALTEGVADVLPVDASGHALLVARLLGWRTGSIAAAIHFGTAFALMAFHWRDVVLIARGVWRLRKRRLEPGTILLGKILLGSLPAILVAGTDFSLSQIADLAVVGGISVVCALIMALADHLCLTIKRIEHMGWGLSLAIGAAQLLALVPGVGRTAAALTVARITGLERPAAFRFVLMTSVPYLIDIGWRDLSALRAQGTNMGGSDAFAAVLTFLLVLVAVQMMTLWLRRGTLLPFALYRLLIGGALIAVAMV